MLFQRICGTTPAGANQGTEPLGSEELTKLRPMAPANDVGTLDEELGLEPTRFSHASGAPSPSVSIMSGEEKGAFVISS